MLRAAITRAEIELHDAGVELPARYAAVVRALKALSPRTLDDGEAMADWLICSSCRPRPVPDSARRWT
ncbi:hypothetical protein GCM10017744_009330 [Streptomyces antimycoticus]